MLELEHVTVRYGRTTAVTGVDLALAAGEIVTLLGPTGCGKSSVLRAVAGMEPIAGGTIRIGELVVDPRHQPPPEKRGVGLLFQDFALFPHLTVQDNVAFRVRDRAIADRWITLLGLDGLRTARPDTLSGGQKQRVALARCLAHEPRVVLLDEPLSNLDAALKATLRWQIREVLETAGVPAIWVTHDQEEALSVGDRVAIMRDGAIVQTDTPEACYRAPADRFVARFLGEGTFLAGTVVGDRVRTALGRARIAEGVRAAHGDGAKLDVLVRPHDLRLVPRGDGRRGDAAVGSCAEGAPGHVRWSRYEGETRLYGVSLDDGRELQVRTSHEHELAVADPVAVTIGAAHPLAVFPSSASEAPRGAA